LGKWTDIGGGVGGGEASSCTGTIGAKGSTVNVIGGAASLAQGLAQARGPAQASAPAQALAWSRAVKMKAEKISAERMAAERVTAEMVMEGRATMKRVTADRMEKRAETDWKLVLLSVEGVSWVGTVAT
jgi:hypothetical protein